MTTAEPVTAAWASAGLGSAAFRSACLDLSFSFSAMLGWAQPAPDPLYGEVLGTASPYSWLSDKVRPGGIRFDGKR